MDRRELIMELERQHSKESDPLALRLIEQKIKRLEDYEVST